MDDSDHDIKQVLPVFPAHLEIVVIYKLFDYISTGRTMLSRCIVEKLSGMTTSNAEV